MLLRSICRYPAMYIGGPHDPSKAGNMSFSYFLNFIFLRRSAYLHNLTAGLSIICILSHPKSRGWIKLKTTNPKDQPEIQPNYFQDKADLRNMAKVIYVIMIEF